MTRRFKLSGQTAFVNALLIAASMMRRFHCSG